ncbi:hypothetical protein [Xanthocytophaga agilis]|uniref:MoxR-vWA-beta-propeller ternary system domain-containing protein n=1 Tax=Xanthocytophaga agilis TaxID=3048010 RepID=A0AAE3R0G1_9BACT|nr:hypothetical protein [Xanthocytophaga agilis]MDJ1501396.1 hypothetical protein [Xanthocytophaga agilis]
MKTVTLTDFITDLTQQGNVTVNATIEPFSEIEKQEACQVLEQYYATTLVDIPHTAPAFLPEAALWGAMLIYRACQSILLRHLTESQVRTYLLPYSGPPSAEAIYSIDLTLRFLPDLMHFAKGLSPDDVLVQLLRNTAQSWPFSSVGVDIEENSDHTTFIRLHPSLKYTYVDRIIQKRDHKRLTHPELYDLVKAALGIHADRFWPELKHVTKDLTHIEY